jgi:hypothetical protein
MLCFEWIHYELELASLRVPFRQQILLKGSRLSSTNAEKTTRVYAKDLRNQIKIVQKMPLLQVKQKLYMIISRTICNC